MKRIHTLIVLTTLSILLIGCAVSNTPYAYDDIYYSPSQDPVQQARVDAPATQYETGNQNEYNDRYSQNNEENPNAANYQDSYAAHDNSAGGESEASEYYDEDYAQTMQQINAPVRSFDTYDPYQRDRILYTQNPVFTTPSVYGGYQFWDPFMPTTGLSVGWNSFNGWNVGVNAGYGFGCGGALNPYFGYNNSLWVNNWGWNDPFWGAHGYNNWGYGNNFYRGNNWGWNNGYNNNAFRQGYRQGYRESNYNNYTVGNQGDGRRNISSRRGSSGSNTVVSGGNNKPVRPVRSNGNRTTTNSPTTPARTTVRPDRSGTASPTTESRSNQQTRPTQTNTRPVRTTPNRYQRPATNTRPTTTTPSRTNTRPTTTTPSRSATRPSQPQQQTRPNSSRPTYSKPVAKPAQQQAKPKTTTTRTQPRQQSRPSYNNSRPNYTAPTNNNRNSGSSTSPSRSTPSRSTPSRSTPSRPSRR